MSLRQQFPSHRLYSKPNINPHSTFLLTYCVINVRVISFDFVKGFFGFQSVSSSRSVVVRQAMVSASLNINCHKITTSEIQATKYETLEKQETNKIRDYSTQQKTRKLEQVCFDILQQTCYQQVDIRMRRHGLRQLVDDKSIASCQQTCCKLIVKTCSPQACYKFVSANDKLQQS